MKIAAPKIPNNGRYIKHLATHDHSAPARASTCHHCDFQGDMKAPEHTKPHYSKTIQNILDFDIQHGKQWTKRWVAHARGAGNAVDGYVACTWHTLCRKALQHYQGLVG